MLAIEDIKPFGFDEKISGDSDEGIKIRNLAKLIMTKNFLEIIWATETLEPQWEIIYGTTNCDMANFKCKHWGFIPLTQKDGQLLTQGVSRKKGYVVTAEKKIWCIM